jgi:hypothetical protein
VGLTDVLLGPRPSLPSLRSWISFQSPSFVRLVHRYYGAVRLLRSVHAYRTAISLHRPVCSTSVGRQIGGLPVLVHEVSLACLGSTTTQGSRHPRACACLDVAFPFTQQGQHPGLCFRSSIPCPPVPLFTLRSCLTTGNAKLEVRMVRYSFPVRLFHSLLHAGLSRRSGCPGFLLRSFLLNVPYERNGEKHGPTSCLFGLLW